MLNSLNAIVSHFVQIQCEDSINPRKVLGKFCFTTAGLAGLHVVRLVEHLTTEWKVPGSIPMAGLITRVLKRNEGTSFALQTASPSRGSDDQWWSISWRRHKKIVPSHSSFHTEYIDTQMKYYVFYSVPADSSIKGRTASINEQLSQVRMYILLMPWNHVLHCFCAQHQFNIGGNKKLDGTRCSMLKD